MKKKKKKLIGSNLEGTISLTSKGFGFVTPTNCPILKNLDIFIPKRDVNTAIDKDKVEVKIVSWIDKSKGPEGIITKILKRTNNGLTGTVIEKNKDNYIAFVPTSGIMRFVQFQTKSKKVKEGSRVLIEVTDWTDQNRPIIGNFKKCFGDISDPSTDIKVAVNEFNLRENFPSDVLEEIKDLGTKVKKEDLKDRVDLTNDVCITIDPETAKDFDDAISCFKDDKEKFHLGVHIADAAHYVKTGSLLDKEAYNRCNSTYFPGTCIPMLPTALSNNLCSLQEKKIRLCISVSMVFNKSGKLLDYKIFRSFIKSKKRFTYQEAYKIIQNPTSESPFSSLLKTMTELGTLLKKKRRERGSIDFALPEAVVEVDKKGTPLGIKIVEYDISHQLIEEFMLKANEVVATHLSKKGKNLIYRTHEEPSPQNFEDFYNFARSLGFKLPRKPKHKDVQELFQKASKTPFLQQLSINFIRSMKIALYSSDNIGHYGLSLKFYTHFTSPIRRYNDLIIQKLLFNEEIEFERLNEIAGKCSEKERSSFKAETSVVFMKKLRLLQSYFLEDPDRKYLAVVNKIKPYHVSFELQDLFLEGSLHVSELPDDYYNYNSKTLILEGRHSHKRFSHGEKIFVKPVKIDLPFLKVTWKICKKKSGKKRKR